MKVKVYVNQHESVSHKQIRHAYDFSLCFLHELLMSFLKDDTEHQHLHYPNRQRLLYFINVPEI